MVYGREWWTRNKLDKASNRTIRCLSVNMSFSVDISDHINYLFYLFKLSVNEVFLLRGLHAWIKPGGGGTRRKIG